MRIGIAQIETRAGDLERTCGRIVAYSREAAGRGVELLVVPMAALSGPLPVEYTELEGFLTDLRDALDDLSERVACPCLVPVVWDMDGDPLPEAMLVEDGEVAPLKFMAYLSSLGEPREGAHGGDDPWGPAPDLPVITIGDTTLGIAFTYDDLDDFLDYDLGVDAVVYLAGYGFELDDPSSALGAALAENRYLRDAQDMDAWIVGVGSLGGYGTQVFTGSSFVVTPQGEVAALAAAFDEELLVCDVDPKATGPLAKPVTPEVYNRPLHLWQTLVTGLKGFVGGTPGVNDVVIKLDGSLQSLLLGVLATDALGPTHVHAILSPGVADDRLAWSREVARNLRIDTHELAVGDVLPRNMAGTEGQDLLVDLVEARLAALARQVGGMVLGAEDKTALALELRDSRCWAAELMPFGDVYRSDLLELAHLRNAISPAIPLVAEQSYAVPMVDGLPATHATTREERLREVDLVLAGHLEGGRSLSELVDHGTPREFAEAVLGRLCETEHLRCGRVLYLMVTSRTLFDARRPLGLVWCDSYREPSRRINDQDVWERLTRMGEELIGAAPVSKLAGDSGGDTRDVLGYLSDFARGAEHGDGHGSGDGMADRGWQNPFSDN